jgi:hypothetical protein
MTALVLAVGLLRLGWIGIVILIALAALRFFMARGRQ